MGLSRDSTGVETIPLRLMIVTAIVALSVLPAAQALETLRTRDFLQRASEQLDAIADAVEVIVTEGPGSVRTQGLDFSSSGDVGFESIRVGGDRDGPNSTSIALLLNTGATLVRVLPHDGVAISARDGGPLVVSYAQFDLRMVAEFERGEFWIMVEAL